jgi:multicomponent Na+:H+ antiporter subunit E
MLTRSTASQPPFVGPAAAPLAAAARGRARTTLRWTVTLFAFWILLSGKLDPLHLVMGAACAALVALAARPLLELPPAIGPGASGPMPLALAGRFAAFQLWLLGQIVVGSCQVAWAVLHPRLPIAPRLLWVRASLPHPLARLVLANSITLTPGTATLDIDGDWLVVHALGETSARGLGSPEAEGEMTRRVRAVFDPGGGNA